ncbi:MAG: 2'-deoxycytidine 5'-triphosphate deaminase [Rhodospirillaceae bacterium]|nr:2'-deoxycytidine 5'-triphosphate deaminase [Rhodospirillaceae bacterium]MDD9927124.1 2'-deoxycytidine 5'-triphosphate deaminase [Rhodospirillaceae bacterium]
MNEQSAQIATAAVETGHATGVLPSQSIRELIEQGNIRAENAIEDAQIQPASLDLRLGTVAHRVQASFLPGEGATVQDKIAQFGLHALDITDGAVLETGCVYIVPLQESLDLESRLAAIANPKSSTGRLDIFTRLITDNGVEFDRVRGGYKGPLYAEISPRTFSIVIRTGARLNQLRLKKGRFSYSERAIRRLNQEVGLVEAGPSSLDLKDGIPFTVDLEGDPNTGLVGFRARKNTGLIDVDRKGQYDPVEFWEPIYRGKDPTVILNPDDFYILASREAVTVPADHAAEMVAYDTLVGEFRVHYAGFFDPGFGDDAAGGGGSRAVLEVRSHDVPFMIEHGQILGRLVYERLTEPPDRIYGQGIGSSYQRQGLQLGKHFTPWPER